LPINQTRPVHSRVVPEKAFTRRKPTWRVMLDPLTRGCHGATSDIRPWRLRRRTRVLLGIA
jgi:hypothetical protein